MKKYGFLLSLLIAVACSNDDDGQAGGHELELVFEDSTYQLTGVAKDEGAPLLVNYPRWSSVYLYGVVTANGKTGKTPFPDEAMNQWQMGEAGIDKWVCVQSVYYDDAGVLWVLDPAAPMMGTIQGNGAKLVKMNGAGGVAERTYSFMSILADTSYVNDVRVDVERQYAYLSESKGGGIVVLNLGDGQMRRVLADHYSTKSDPAFKFIVDGRELMKDGKPVKINSDGIALTPDGAWLYYKPLTDDKLYRINTALLRDWSKTEAELGAAVQDLGHFTTTDGMIFDSKGNLYLGDLQQYRLVRLDTALKMTTIVQDDRLIWPDSYAIADGYLYVSCSQIQRQPEYNEGVNKRTSPYTVFRIRI
jgi:sugar lactone lactonase YvrE